MHGSRCPSTDVSDAATRAGHVGSDGVNGMTTTPRMPSERAKHKLRQDFSRRKSEDALTVHEHAAATRPAPVRLGRVIRALRALRERLRMTREEAGHERVVGGGEQIQRDGSTQAAGRLGHDHAPQCRQRLGHPACSQRRCVELAAIDEPKTVEEVIVGISAGVCDVRQVSPPALTALSRLPRRFSRSSCRARSGPRAVGRSAGRPRSP